MSPKRPERRRRRNLLRRRGARPPATSEPATQEAVAPERPSRPAVGIAPADVPQLPPGRPAPEPARIGRITSTFHTARLSPWEIALHPNRLAEIPATLDAIVIDATSTLAGSVWAGWAGPSGRTTAGALRTAIGAARETRTVVVFRWDMGGGADVSDVLESVAREASVETAAPGSGRSGSLVTLAYGVSPAFVRTGRGRRVGEGLGMVVPDAFEGWADPAPPEDPAPSHAVTVGAATLADPEALALWFGSIRTLALPRPPSPQTLQVAAEAVAGGVTLDDGLSATPVPAAQVLDQVLAMAGRER